MLTDPQLLATYSAHCSSCYTVLQSSVRSLSFQQIVVWFKMELLFKDVGILRKLTSSPPPPLGNNSGPAQFWLF